MYTPPPPPQLPTTGHGITAAGGPCTISILDQRDWGGCVDLNLAAAAAPGGGGGPTPTQLPTLPPTVGRDLQISGGQIENAPAGSNCRIFTGVTASIHSNPIAAAYLSYHVCGDDFDSGANRLNLPQSGNALVGTVSIAGEPFQVRVDPASDTTVFTNVSPNSPTICDMTMVPSTRCGAAGVAACTTMPPGNSCAAAAAAAASGALSPVVTTSLVIGGLLIVAIVIAAAVIITVVVVVQKKGGKSSEVGESEMPVRGPPKPPSKPTKGGAQRATALHNYAGADADELSFSKGDVINVLSKSCPEAGDGWWRGELRGVSGFFPANYVQ